MKVLLISFAIGLLVGVLYGVIRGKSPAPPVVALFGLFGMVLGEQAGRWLLTKKIQATSVPSAHIAGERKGQPVCALMPGPPRRSDQAQQTQPIPIAAGRSRQPEIDDTSA
jgi:XapX domain-containing protein